MFLNILKHYDNILADQNDTSSPIQVSRSNGPKSCHTIWPKMLSQAKTSDFYCNMVQILNNFVTFVFKSAGSWEVVWTWFPKHGASQCFYYYNEYPLKYFGCQKLCSRHLLNFHSYWHSPFYNKIIEIAFSYINPKLLSPFHIH